MPRSSSHYGTLLNTFTNITRDAFLPSIVTRGFVETGLAPLQLPPPFISISCNLQFFFFLSLMSDNDKKKKKQFHFRNAIIIHALRYLYRDEWIIARWIIYLRVILSFFFLITFYIVLYIVLQSNTRAIFEINVDGLSRFRGVVVITSALHAEDHRFDSGRNHLTFTYFSVRDSSTCEYFSLKLKS